jgi:hypothetical protein
MALYESYLLKILKRKRKKRREINGILTLQFHTVFSSKLFAHFASDNRIKFVTHGEILKGFLSYTVIILMLIIWLILSA